MNPIELCSWREGGWRSRTRREVHNGRRGCGAHPRDVNGLRWRQSRVHRRGRRRSGMVVVRMRWHWLRHHRGLMYHRRCRGRRHLHRRPVHRGRPAGRHVVRVRRAWMGRRATMAALAVVYGARRRRRRTPVLLGRRHPVHGRPPARWVSPGGRRRTVVVLRRPRRTAWSVVSAPGCVVAVAAILRRGGRSCWS